MWYMRLTLWGAAQAAPEVQGQCTGHAGAAADDHQPDCVLGPQHLPHGVSLLRQCELSHRLVSLRTLDLLEHGTPHP